MLKCSEKILLVEDEEMVALVLGQMMKESGYDVITAKCGEEAIMVYQQQKDSIDLVILDMILPDITGGETFDRLKTINPAVKVLLSSGYSVDGQANEILARGCNGFIQKPYNMEAFSLKIRGILD